MLRDLGDAVEFYDLMITDPLMPSIEDLVVSAVPVAKSQLQTKTVEEVDFKPRQKKKRSTPSSSTTKSRARRSTQSKKVGRAGEEEIYHREVAMLKKLGRTDLAEKVIPHYKIGETPGWDITSFDKDGEKLLIEVKSTVGKTMSTVELTRNEWKAAQDSKYRDRYFLYLVMGVFSKKLKIEKMRNPADHVLKIGLSIEPSVFELSLSAD